MPLKPKRPLANPLRIACAITLIAACSAASAQSLKDLYEAARAYDTTYLAARTLAESVAYRVAQSYAGVRPSVGLTAGANRSETKLESFPRYGVTTVQAEINAKYPIFNRGNSLAVEQAEKSLDVAKADLETAEQDLILRVAQAYFDVLAAQDTLGLTQTSKAAITEQLASAKRSFEVGTATITDTREAQARFDLATAQEIAADNDLRTKRAALDQIVGRAGVAPKPLAAPYKLPPLVPAEVDPWVASADTTHPTVIKTRALVDIAKYDTARADAAGYPTVDLVGSFGADHVKASGAAPVTTGDSLTASVGVQLNLPLYAGGSISARQKEAVLLEQKAREDLESARRAVTLAARQLFLGVQSGQAQVLALEAAESSSKLALEATQLGYRVGVRVNLDVLNAQTQLFQTQRDLARARYDVVVAALRLRQASGQLSPTDVDQVTSLLAP
jgi:outer membrane protein